MAFFPISHTMPQYVDTNGNPFSGAVLKAFSAGTSNNIVMATDSTGSTTASSIALNSDGYPEVSGTIVIPHINETYKLRLFPTQAAADLNTGAIWTQDNLSISIDFGSSTQEISTSTVLDSSDSNTHINASGTITITLPDIDSVGAGYLFSIRNSGVGVVTLDGDGSETINGDLTYAIAAGAGGFVISGDTNWSAIGLKDAQVDKVNTFAATQSWTKGADIASATTLVLGTDGNYFDVTGTTGPIGTITVAAGTLFILQFDSTPTLTHNGTNLDLPGEADITAEAGDSLIGFATAANQVHVISYTRADGRAVTASLTLGTPQATTSGSSATFESGISGATQITITLSNFSTNGAAAPMIQIGDSGGYETTSHAGASGRTNAGGSTAANFSTGFSIVDAMPGASAVIHATIVLTLQDSSTNTWLCSINGGFSSEATWFSGGGTKSLSASIDKLRIISTDTFDLGKINVVAEI